MTKAKTIPAPGTKAPGKLTRKEREEIRQAVAEGTTVTVEDMTVALRQQPRGMLSVTVLIDSLWPKFLKEAGITPPVREEKECDIDFNSRVRSFNSAMSVIRRFAPFWYFCGLRHDENIRQLLDVLDSTQDASAPEDNEPEYYEHFDNDEQPAE